MMTVYSVTSSERRDVFSCAKVQPGAERSYRRTLLRSQWRRSGFSRKYRRLSKLTSAFMPDWFSGFDVDADGKWEVCTTRSWNRVKIVASNSCGEWWIFINLRSCRARPERRDLPI